MLELQRKQKELDMLRSQIQEKDQQNNLLSQQLRRAHKQIKNLKNQSTQRVVFGQKLDMGQGENGALENPPKNSPQSLSQISNLGSAPQNRPSQLLLKQLESPQYSSPGPNRHFFNGETVKLLRHSQNSSEPATSTKIQASAQSSATAQKQENEELCAQHKMAKQVPSPISKRKPHNLNEEVDMCLNKMNKICDQIIKQQQLKRVIDVRSKRLKIDVNAPQVPGAVYAKTPQPSSNPKKELFRTLNLEAKERKPQKEEKEFLEKIKKYKKNSDVIASQLLKDQIINFFFSDSNERGARGEPTPTAN